MFSDLDRKLGHYRRYTKTSLKALIDNKKFRIVKIKYFDFLGIIPWLIYFKVLRKTIASNNVSIYDKLIVPIEKNIEGIIKPIIGKNILLIAQKKH